jgi:hypothetical protein
MNQVLDFLSGKKTYILAGLGTIVVGLWMFGVIDQATADYVLAAIGLGSIAALRAGIAKS